MPISFTVCKKWIIKNYINCSYVTYTTWASNRKLIKSVLNYFLFDQGGVLNISRREKLEKASLYDSVNSRKDEGEEDGERDPLLPDKESPRIN